MTALKKRIDGTYRNFAGRKNFYGIAIHKRKYFIRKKICIRNFVKIRE